MAVRGMSFLPTSSTPSNRGKISPYVSDYYTVDLRLNAVIRKHVDLEDLGRELKVLEPYEELIQERFHRGIRLDCRFIFTGATAVRQFSSSQG